MQRRFVWHYTWGKKKGFYFSWWDKGSLGAVVKYLQSIFLLLFFLIKMWSHYLTVGSLFPKSCFLVRCVRESAVAGSNRLWLGPVWSLPFCLLEALLDTMEGARSFAHYQRGHSIPHSQHEPPALAACSKAASLHSSGPTSTQPPWVVPLLHRQRAHSSGISRISGSSHVSHVSTACGQSDRRGGDEDQSHISRHSTGRS